jgi:hypothetical protein
MSLAIRAASLTDDQPQLIGILERNIPGRQEGHFEWRHQANPAGPGWSWVACDRNDAIVAMASVFPRNVWVDGKRLICGQVGEFVVDAPYRSLGPALMLQRATFTPVDSGELAFCYDCPPHDQGMSTFVRLGMSAAAEVIRYALPLTANEFLAKKIGTEVWTKPLVAGANLILSMRRRGANGHGLEISEFNSAFGEEFTQLDAQVPSSGVIRASRSSQDMTWRYQKNPAWKSRVLVARRAGELVGFLTFVTFGERASIVDIFGRPPAEMALPLLHTMIDLCRREKRGCIEGYCSDASELSAFFKQAGLRRRERAARVVAYSKGNEKVRAQLHSGLRWAFSQVEIML